MSVLDKLFLILAVAVAVISIADGDWMWFIVAFVGITAVIWPMLKKGITYNRFLLILSIVPLMAQAFMGILMLANGRGDELWVISLILQTWTSVVFGYMLALIIDEYTDIKLSKRWVLMFALLFSLMISGVYLFFQFTSLYVAGYPVFNYELQGIVTTEERIWMNSRLMMPCAIATPVSIIVALVLRQWTKATDALDIREGRTDG